MGYRGHRVTVIARQSPESSRGATRPSAASRLQWGLRALAAGLISSAGVHHAFGAVDAAGLAVAAALRHQPLVISLDVVDRQRWEATARTAHRLLLEAMDRAAAIVVASEYAAARLRQEYDRDAEVLVPGVFCDAFRMPRRLDSTRAIVSPAHPVAGRAGICVLLEAFGHLASEMPDVKLHLFGAPPSSWLVKQLDRLDAVVAPRIH